jgi:uncharacterized membrane protein
MDRDRLDFVIVGGIGVVVLIYLVAAILHDLGLFRSIPFYLSLQSDSFMVILWILALGSVLFLPIAFYVERRIMHYPRAKRNWHKISIPFQNRAVRIGIRRPVDYDEEDRPRSEHT